MNQSHKLCVFSSLSGTLYKSGKPMPNAKIIRTAGWQKKTTDMTVTDVNGFFKLPVMNENTIASSLPMQFVARQELMVFDGEQEIVIWSGAKTEKEENSESRGNPLAIECDLDKKDVAIHVNGQAFVTKCEWGVEVDSPVSADDFFNSGA